MRFRCALLVGLLAAVPVSCNSSSGDLDFPGIDSGTQRPTTRAVVNGWEVTLRPESGGWRVSDPEGETVLSSADSVPPVRIGRGAPEVRNEFGAFRIDLVGEDSGVDWRSPPEQVAQLRREGGGWAIVWSLAGSNSDAASAASARLQFRAARGDDLRISLRASGIEADAGEMNLSCASGESFFGLGTQVTGLNLRGRTYPLWSQEQGVGKPEDGGFFPLNQPPEAAYAPMGVWHSSGGYSAIVDRDAYGGVGFCHESDAIRLRNFEQMPSYTFLLSGTPEERVERVTDYVGRLEVRPPEWVFGPWLTAVGGPERLREVATTARVREIPATAIWTEDWIGWDGEGANRRLTYAWEWDDGQYPDLPSRVEDLHADGFAFLGYFNPFVPEPTFMWEDGMEEGYLLRNSEGEKVTLRDPAMRNASMVELSNDGAVRWLQQNQRAAIAQVGLDGWMADFAEWYPLEAQPESGVSSWVFHNRYPREWASVNRETIEAERPDDADRGERVFFTRSGWASTNGGSGAVAPAMWAGDQETNWARNDGLPSVIPIIAHAGLSGVPIMGSDIGGFSSGEAAPRDKELYLRWTEMAAFHPLMRQHHGDLECENWSFDRDEETLEHFERYATIHNLLYPYLEAHLDAAMDSGLPIARHPWLVEPDREALWSGEDWLYFLGDDLLVAPVLAEGATERTVELPSRGWWPLFGDGPVGNSAEPRENGVRLRAEAPVTEIPVYVRPGTALPLLAERVDSLYGATTDGVTDLSDREGAHRIALYPDADGNAELDGLDGLSLSASGAPRSPDLGEVDVVLDGVALPSCEGADDSADCVDEQLDLVRLRDLREATLAVGEGDIAVDSDEPVELTIGFGRAAWEEWADPTTLENLESEAPSYCEDASDGGG